MNVVFQEGTNIVKDLQLGYGGMAPTTVLAKATSNKLIGRCVYVDCDATQIIIHISMHTTMISYLVTRPNQSRCSLWQ